VFEKSMPRFLKKARYFKKRNVNGTGKGKGSQRQSSKTCLIPKSEGEEKRNGGVGSRKFYYQF